MLIPGIHDNIILLNNQIEKLKEIDLFLKQDVKFKLNFQQSLQGDEINSKITELIKLMQVFNNSLKNNNPEVIK